MPRIAALAAALAALDARAQSDEKPLKNELPGPTVPYGWGVNIHFTTPEPGEMARFAEARFGLARMDLFWNRVEKKKGTYDFSAYDGLLAALEKAGTRPLFILDYGNDLYEQGSPRSPEARAAFARFAAAAARHFRGRRVLFEIWNEPNLGNFWKPEPDARQYALLAVAAARAIKAADPEAIVFAPGASGFPWEFLETVFAAGLLSHIDGVSVHPYRGLNPETASADFARLRALIARHAPEGRRYLPILSSEWGYSTVTNGVGEARQAAYLTRMWLANLASGVNLSVFYDWRDDGDDPKENEHRFGTVRRRDFAPKPAFLAAKALIDDLYGFTYRHRLKGRTENDWRLLFQGGEGDELAVVSWSADPKAAEADQTPRVRKVRPSDPDGRVLRRLASLRLPNGPLVEGGDETAQVRMEIRNTEAAAVSVEVILTEVGGTRSVRLGPTTVEPRLPGVLSQLVPVQGLRAAERWFAPRLLWGGAELPQVAPLRIVRLDPLEVSVAPAHGEVRALVSNPAGLAFAGKVLLVSRAATLAERPLVIGKGEKRGDATLPMPAAGSAFEVRLVDAGGAVVARLPARRYVPLAGFAAKPGAPSGFERVRFVENARQTPEPLVVAPAPDRSPAENVLKIDYDFPKGWQYLQASPVAPLAIPDRATAFTVWVYSDGPGDFLRSRFKDATGQTFQVDLDKLDWRGWRLMTVPLDGTKVGAYWGGANDGVPHRPLGWDGLVLIDSANREKAHRDVVFLAAPYYQVLP